MTEGFVTATYLFNELAEYAGSSLRRMTPRCGRVNLGLKYDPQRRGRRSEGRPPDFLKTARGRHREDLLPPGTSFADFRHDPERDCGGEGDSVELMMALHYRAAVADHYLHELRFREALDRLFCSGALEWRDGGFAVTAAESDRAGFALAIKLKDGVWGAATKDSRSRFVVPAVVANSWQWAKANWRDPPKTTTGEKSARFKFTSGAVIDVSAVRSLAEAEEVAFGRERCAELDKLWRRLAAQRRRRRLIRWGAAVVAMALIVGSIAVQHRRVRTSQASLFEAEGDKAMGVHHLRLASAWYAAAYDRQQTPDRLTKLLQASHPQLLGHLALSTRISGNGVEQAQVSSGGKYLAALVSNRLRVWDTPSGALLWSREIAERPAQVLCWARNDHELLVRTGKDLLALEANTGVVRATPGIPGLTDEPLVAAACGKNGPFAVAWQQGGQKAGEAARPVLVAGMMKPIGAIREMNFHLKISRPLLPSSVGLALSGTRLALVGCEKEGPLGCGAPVVHALQLVRAGTADRGAELRGQTYQMSEKVGHLTRAAFSADGRLLALASSTGVWIAMTAEGAALAREAPASQESVGGSASRPSSDTATPHTWTLDGLRGPLRPRPSWVRSLRWTPEVNTLTVVYEGNGYDVFDFRPPLLPGQGAWEVLPHKNVPGAHGMRVSNRSPGTILLHTRASGSVAVQVQPAQHHGLGRYQVMEGLGDADGEVVMQEPDGDVELSLDTRTLIRRVAGGIEVWRREPALWAVSRLPRHEIVDASLSPDGTRVSVVRRALAGAPLSPSLFLCTEDSTGKGGPYRVLPAAFGATGEHRWLKQVQAIEAAWCDAGTRDHCVEHVAALLDATSLRETRRYVARGDGLARAIFSHDAERVALSECAAGEAGAACRRRIRFLDTRSGAAVDEVPVAADAEYVRVDWAPASRRAAIRDGSLYLWEEGKGAFRVRWRPGPPSGGLDGPVHWSPDGERLTARRKTIRKASKSGHATFGTTVVLVDARRAVELAELAFGDYAPVEWSADSRVVAVGDTLFDRNGTHIGRAGQPGVDVTPMVPGPPYWMVGVMSDRVVLESRVTWALAAKPPRQLFEETLAAAGYSWPERLPSEARPEELRRRGPDGQLHERSWTERAKRRLVTLLERLGCAVGVVERIEGPVERD
jgi:hypothetical protein